MIKKIVTVQAYHQIHVDHTELSLEKPSIFFFHGLSGRGEQWSYFKKNLETRANLIIPDFLGHGKSDKPKNSEYYAFDKMYQTIENIFNEFSTEENYIVAHSLSSTWACKLAQQYTSKINKLILISPMTCEPQKLIHNIRFIPSNILSFIQDQFGDYFFKLSFSNSADPEIVKREIEATKKIPAEVIKALVASTKDISLIDVKNLEAKTLLITAENDKVISQKQSIAFYRQLPHVELIEIKNAGHLSFLEKPEEVFQIIEKFLFD